MDSHYKPLIVSDVQRAISAVNGIVVLLQGQTLPASSSELIEKSYPQVTLGQFLAFNQTIVEVCFLVSDASSKMLITLARVWVLLTRRYPDGSWRPESA